MASGLVWTKHLEERLASRGISYNEAWETVKYPTKSLKLGEKKWKLFKSFGSKQVVLVAVFETGQWVVLTGWTKSLQAGRLRGDEHGFSRIARRFLFGFLDRLAQWFAHLGK